MILRDFAELIVPQSGIVIIAVELDLEQANSMGQGAVQ